MALFNIGKLHLGRRSSAQPDARQAEPRPDPDDPARFDAPEYVHHADYDRFEGEYDGGYDPQPMSPEEPDYDSGTSQSHPGDSWAADDAPYDPYGMAPSDGEPYNPYDSASGNDAPYGPYGGAPMDDTPYDPYGGAPMDDTPYDPYGGAPMDDAPYDPYGGAPMDDTPYDPYSEDGYDGGQEGYGDTDDGYGGLPGNYPGNEYGYDRMPRQGYPRMDNSDMDDGRGYAPGWWEAALDWMNTRTWPIWALLLLLPPLGIWLLWRYQRYRQNARAVLSVLSIAWCLFALSWLIPRPIDTSHLTLPMNTVDEEPAPVESGNLPEYTESVLANTPLPVMDAGEDDPDAVYIDETGSFYHKLSSCTALKGGESLRRVTAQSAGNVGLFACPYCIASTYTENTWDLIFVNTETQDRSGFPIYCTTDNPYLHVERYCGGLANAREFTLKDALLMGRMPCPDCCAILERKVYFTADGTYFHIESDCSGMRNASHPSYAEALVTGKKRCPRCLPGEDKFLAGLRGDSADETATEYYVYATAKGKYYHIDEHCQGMQNASKVSLRDAIDRHRPACPVCCPNAELIVFVSDGSPYYHSFVSCSGMTDATQSTMIEAMASGKQRCPDCWKTESQ